MIQTILRKNKEHLFTSPLSSSPTCSPGLVPVRPQDYPPLFLPSTESSCFSCSSVSQETSHQLTSKRTARDSQGCRQGSYFSITVMPVDLKSPNYFILLLCLKFRFTWQKSTSSSCSTHTELVTYPVTSSWHSNLPDPLYLKLSITDTGGAVCLPRGFGLDPLRITRDFRGYPLSARERQG